MKDPKFTVLFLCAGNSARSILAEAILARLGVGRFAAFSAGSDPAGTVHPLALDILKGQNYPIGTLRSKNWDEFAGPDAIEPDFVFTLCDSAAGEACPIWPGQPLRAHWGLPDPAAVSGSTAIRRLAFADTYRTLTNRIATFISLPFESLDRTSLQQRVDAIGTTDASAPP